MIEGGDLVYIAVVYQQAGEGKPRLALILRSALLAARLEGSTATHLRDVAKCRSSR